MPGSTRAFVRSLHALVRPYWVGDDRWRGRALLAAIVSLNLGLVALNVAYSNWNNRFYDALQRHDPGAFWRQLAFFCALAAAFIGVAVYQTYLNQMLQIRWRRWLTEHALADWLGSSAFYHLQRGDGTRDRGDRGADNPDQRIAEDLQLFVDATLNLGLGLLSAIVTLGSFAHILWRLSGTLELPLGAHSLHLPGYMLWAAVAYALAGSWITHRLGRPLVGLNFGQQRLEADFRFGLVRLRENAEAIALWRGEGEEARGLRERFAAIVANWWAIMRRRKRLTWFTAGYDQAAVVFPILAAAPRYFAGALQLGGLMQTAQAFGQVQAALSWFVSAYASLAQWRATVERLSGFRAAVAATREHATASGIRRTNSADGAVAIRALRLQLPDGRRLVDGLDLTVRAGEALLVTGASGTGKSTLLRAIAGIWPTGSGDIDAPPRDTMLFLPQRPYLPIGSLRRAICYPSPPTVAPAAVAAALAACELSPLVPRLDESTDWSLRLSPGEQQRVALARAWLLQPACLFLDEATSALDEATEARIYSRLRQRFAGSIVVSVAHRPGLRRWHDRELVLRPPDAAQLLPESPWVGFSTSSWVSNAKSVCR